MKSVYHRVLVHNHIVRFGVVTFFSVFFYVLQRFRRFRLLATAIPHHTFRKLPPCQARKVGSNLRNRADHVIMPVNQSSSFRRFRSANYFPHSANYPYPFCGVLRFSVILHLLKSYIPTFTFTFSQP